MKVLLSSFHLNGHTLGFIPRLKSENHPVQQCKNEPITDMNNPNENTVHNKSCEWTQTV